MWDFETEPDFQQKLDWVDQFVREEVEPLDLVLGDPYDKSDEQAMRILRPLQQQVKDQGLWAVHLGPELGGQGYGQVKLALLNELLGRSRWAPSVFGCQAPDSGNAEILAHYGTDEQKAQYLQPLLDGEISSCYSMTEPHAGADPTLFKVRAELDGDEWVINGEKWFSTNARFASFFIVMAVTNPDVSAYQGMSMFIVPAETPGVEIIRNVGLGDGAPRATAPTATCATRTCGCRPTTCSAARARRSSSPRPASAAAASTTPCAPSRMAAQGVRHDVRAGGVARRPALGPLASMQMTQEKVADSWIEIEQFRLLVLRTAWLIDKHNDYKRVRKDIAAVKVAMPKVLHDVAQRALHLHGALGVSNEMPFVGMMMAAEVARPRRRPDRGAQDHARPPAPQGLHARRRPLPVRPPPHPPGGGARPPGRPPRARDRRADCVPGHAGRCGPLLRWRSVARTTRTLDPVSPPSSGPGGPPT